MSGKKIWDDGWESLGQKIEHYNIFIVGFEPKIYD